MPPTPNGSDGRGRFALGNAGGPGNPNARIAHKWRERLAGIVSDDDFDGIIRRMVADAVAGDKDARNQLLDRLCGKAGSVQDEPEQRELKVIRIRPIPPQDKFLRMAPGSFPPDE